MNKTSNTDSYHANARKKALIQRIAIIATTVIVAICCVVVMVKKREEKVFERQRDEAIYQAMCQEKLRCEQEEAARAEEQRLREVEDQRIRDSIAALPKIELPEPKWSWNDVEKMVRDLTDEDYFAYTWNVGHKSPNKVVIYSKGGNTYFRHFNVEKKTYGAKIRLIKDEGGNYHAYGNKRDRYVGRGKELVHEINGVEKERFYYRSTVDLFTPEPAPDGYEDWEEYYDDNAEDLRFYYGY